MIGSSRNYAIGMAHFQIAGGIKTLLLVCGVYLLLFCMGLSLYYYMDFNSGTRSGLNSAIITLLMIFEAVVLLILGSFRVASAIRTDVSSRMIESHRLMPVPGWRAVMGYIFGGTTHAIAFALLNVALAYIFAGITSTSFLHVTYNQGVLFAFAILVWTFTALGTLLFRHAYFIVLTALLIGGCVLVYAYMVLPGFALLIGPMIGETVFNFSGPPRASQWSYMISLAGQAVFAVLFFAGACRRYRGTYPTTFSAIQAVLLMLMWCTISIAGLALWSDFHFGGRRFSDDEGGFLRRTQLIASLASALIFTLIPLSTAAAAGSRKKLTQFSVWAICVLATAAIPLGLARAASTAVRFFTGVTENVRVATDGRSVAVTALVAAAHGIVLWSLLVLFRKTRPWIKWVVIGLGIMAYWMVPLILELIRIIIEKPAHEDAAFGVLGTISPLGMLITTWNGVDNGPSPAFGLVLQCGLAMVLGAMAILPRRPRLAPAGPLIPPITVSPAAIAPVPAAIPAETLTPGPRDPGT